MRLAYEISKAAANMIRCEEQPHITAMQSLVRDYIAVPENPTIVDWDFLFDRTMKEKSNWASSDRDRDEKAWKALIAIGYKPADVVDAPEVGLDDTSGE